MQFPDGTEFFAADGITIAYLASGQGAPMYVGLGSDIFYEVKVTDFYGSGMEHRFSFVDPYTHSVGVIDRHSHDTITIFPGSDYTKTDPPLVEPEIVPLPVDRQPEELFRLNGQIIYASSDNNASRRATLKIFFGPPEDMKALDIVDAILNDAPIGVAKAEPGTVIRTTAGVLKVAEFEDRTNAAWNGIPLTGLNPIHECSVWEGESRAQVCFEPERPWYTLAETNIGMMRLTRDRTRLGEREEFQGLTADGTFVLVNDGDKGEVVFIETLGRLSDDRYSPTPAEVQSAVTLENGTRSIQTSRGRVYLPTQPGPAERKVRPSLDGKLLVNPASVITKLGMQRGRSGPASGLAGA